MKKRIVTLLTALVMLVCLLWVPSMATEPKVAAQANTALQAGYASVDITPQLGLPLQGYGDPARLSTENEGTLNVTCIAITDTNNTTALFLSVDTYNTNQQWSNDAKAAIVEALGENVINIDRIYISATGTMSAPELIYTGTDEEVGAKVATYRETVIAACATAAQNAMADRTAVTMSVGKVNTSAVLAQQMTAQTGETVNDGDVTTRLIYSTHYTVTNQSGESWVAGVAFGPTAAINSSNYTVSETFKPYDILAMLQFTPTDGSKQPIVLANWAARANLSSTSSVKYGELNHTKASADYVGYFRDAMTAANVRSAFFQSTSGNTSAFSMDISEQNPNLMEQITYTDAESQTQTVSSVTPNQYGQALAAMATYGLQNSMADQADPTVKNMKVRFSTEPDVPTLEQVNLVNALKSTPYSAGGMDLDDENDGTEYANIYEYLLANWAEKANYESAYPELANLVHQAELSGINTRMAHSVGANSTNFATDAVYCDTTVLTLGDITFAMAPCDLYDNYGVSDGNGGYIKTWSKSGVDFILGSTNGNSGALPSYVCYTYNSDPTLLNNGKAYYQGTNVTLTTPFPNGAGERLMETYANIKKTLSAAVDNAENQIRVMCECGGLAAGKPNHTCEDKNFYPWYDPDSLPVDGNYYLMTDVTLYGEARTGVGHKSFDLNGYTITRKVLPEILLDQTLPSEGVKYYPSTRLFAMESNARLTVTDTVGGGKLTRDISALDDYGTDENAKIENYGLLIAIIQGNVNENIIYKADLDAAGQVSGGGCCVGNLSDTATFTMYDGTLTGGISDRGNAIYGNGTNKLYGGTITAATAGKNGVVNVVSNGKLLLAGDATVTGSTNAQGEDCNITVGSQCLTVDPGYTGTAGITVRSVDDPNGHIIGTKLADNTDAHLAAQLTVDNFDDYCVTTCEGVIMVADIREYCVCGGKAHDEHAHEQELVSWKPWPIAYSAYLPSASLGGNYYLLNDVTTSTQRSVLTTLHLDLNGHNITHKVNPEDESFPQNTRVFFVGQGGTLTVTDSTENPGTITRDLSLLTEEQKNSITNYGLIILINEEADGDCILFDGILDATGQISGGGACVANLTKDVYFRMYGGELRGGIASTGGCLYSSGPVELHDGTISGGKATGATGVGGVAIVSLTGDRTGSLNICGDVSISGNLDKNDNPSNIKVNTGYKNFRIADDFTGQIGITLMQQPAHNLPVAVSDAVDLEAATITADGYTDGFKFNVENGYLLVYMDAAQITDAEGNVTYYDTLNEAFAAAQDKTPITLLRPVAEETLSLTRDTYLDLNGWDVTNTTFNDNGFKLFVMDTETDDYTVTAGEKHYTYDAEAKDYVLTVGNGYGIMTGAAAAAAQSAGEGYETVLAGKEKPIDLYLKLTENETEVSFHRLNLRFAGITLRPDSMKDGTNWPGVYYNSQFGGDEVIKRNITTYGVGMSAVDGEEMFTREKSYTALSANDWQVGCDANGNSLNVSNGTILTGIMKNTNIDMVNRRNGTRQIRGQNYILLKDSTRVVGPEISFSLRDIFEGNGITGIDDSYAGMKESEKTGIETLYNTYYNVMKYWDLPNLKEAFGK